MLSQNPNIIYKVVRVINGEMRSAAVNPSREISILYKKGVRVYPRVGKIYAFSSRKLAGIFARSVKGLAIIRIWEARGTRSETSPFITPLILSTISDRTLETLRDFWKGNMTNYHWKYAPEGTILCDSIKLVKMIKEY